MTLANRMAVITAASAGIGRVIAWVTASKGAAVAAVHNTAERRGHLLPCQ